ncbi:hypothetical protein B1987_24090, partial [Mycobacterium kansasii]
MAQRNGILREPTPEPSGGRTVIRRRRHAGAGFAASTARDTGRTTAGPGKANATRGAGCARVDAVLAGAAGACVGAGAAVAAGAVDLSALPRLLALQPAAKPTTTRQAPTQDHPAGWTTEPLASLVFQCAGVWSDAVASTAPWGLPAPLRLNAVGAVGAGDAGWAVAAPAGSRAA